MNNQIILTITEDKIKCDWWTKETQELFCEMCPKKGGKDCKPIECEIANPWCG